MPLAVISPAKTFNEKLVGAPFPMTEPTSALAVDRAELLDVVRALTKAQIKVLMGVSDNIADLNYSRFALFDTQPRINAAVAFDGPAHKALDIATLGADAQAYAQAHVVTLSGLYGLLRPRDGIRPYRLEMGTKLRTGRGENLYAFWGSRLGTELVSWLDALPVGERFIVNVASQEYWAAVGKHLGGAVVYHIDFPGASVYAKQARGLFCRYMAEAHVLRAEALPAFAEWTQRQAGLAFAYRLAGRSDGEGPDGRRLRFERVTATRGAQPSTRAPSPAAGPTIQVMSGGPVPAAGSSNAARHSGGKSDDGVQVVGSSHGRGKRKASDDPKRDPGTRRAAQARTGSRK